MTGERVVRVNLGTIPDHQLGLDAGSQEAGQRTDWHQDKWAVVINSYGYRWAWARNVKCPCSPASAQIVQPNPNCSVCGGGGYLYYNATGPQNLSGESFTDVQLAILKQTQSYMIRGVCMGINVRDKDFMSMGSWREGEAMLTVQAQNRLGYRDRLIGLDMSIVHSEVVMPKADATTGALTLPLRYLVSTNVFTARTLTHTYKPNRDFVVRKGVFTFQPGVVPAAGTRIAVSYETFPTYVVTSMPNALRLVNNLEDVAQPQTAEGDIFKLPIRAAIQLEDLAHSDPQGR